MKYYCKECGKKVSAKHVKLCRKCFLKKSKHEEVYCLDCGKKLNKHACYRGDKRCRSCSKKYQYKIQPETNHFFGLKGKLSPVFKGGEKSRQKFCIDCGELLNKYAYYEGNIRCKSCARIEDYKDPKNHPQWDGGLSFEPYPIEFNRSLKEKIRNRDNHKCQLCSMTEIINIKKYNRNLNIHHIDYIKENCNEENLISLCSECNPKVNKNRNYWTKYFKILLKGVYCDYF